jgi:hypothetical protein
MKELVKIETKLAKSNNEAALEEELKQLELEENELDL